MSRQQGFGAIAAIVILVILAVMGAAIVGISTSQQISSAQDVMSAKAWQAARAGNEWGLFKALSSTTPADTWKTCSNLTQTIDLTATPVSMSRSRVIPGPSTKGSPLLAWRKLSGSLGLPLWLARLRPARRPMLP
ncbi:MAG: hypothetical protein D4R84_04745 [Rhodocyclaceae bacterium]|nr:MAG: hypothetical protein D4R84_04745 [Rhodocyclaceae bacterium]